MAAAGAGAGAALPAGCRGAAAEARGAGEQAAPRGGGAGLSDPGRGCGREETSGRGAGCGAAVLEEVRGGGSGPRGPQNGVTPGRGRGGLGRGSRTGRGDPGLESGRGGIPGAASGCGIPGVGRGAGVPGADLVPHPHPQPRGSAAVVALGSAQPAGPSRSPESGAFATRAADPLRVARSLGGPSDGGGLSGERGRAAGLPGEGARAGTPAKAVPTPWGREFSVGRAPGCPREEQPCQEGGFSPS